MALTKNDREILDADALRESARLARADLQLKAVLSEALAVYNGETELSAAWARRARAILRMLP
jgi:hypothetical protein